MSGSHPDDPSRPQGLGAPHGDAPGFVSPSGPYARGFGPPSEPGPPQPYGQQPYGRPQYGPPQYGPPGYGPYGPPQQPYGQGDPRPYGPGGPLPPYAPGPAPTGPRGTSARTGVLLVVIGVLVVGLVYGGWLLVMGRDGRVATQPTPTRATTAARPTTTSTAARTTAAPTGSTDGQTGYPTDCVEGEKVTSGAWVATVPTGWACDGEDYDLSLSSSSWDSIWLDHGTGGGDASDCADQLYGLGTLTELPQERWGGITAYAYESDDSGDIYGVRCVVAKGVTYYLGYFPLDASDRDTMRASVTTLLTTWVWT